MSLVGIDAFVSRHPVHVEYFDSGCNFWFVCCCCSCDPDWSNSIKYAFHNCHSVILEIHRKCNEHTEWPAIANAPTLLRKRYSFMTLVPMRMAGYELWWIRKVQRICAGIAHLAANGRCESACVCVFASMTGDCRLTHMNRFNCIKLMGRKWYAARLLIQRVAVAPHKRTDAHCCMGLWLDAIASAHCIWPLQMWV